MIFPSPLSAFRLYHATKKVSFILVLFGDKGGFQKSTIEVIFCLAVSCGSPSFRVIWGKSFCEGTSHSGRGAAPAPY